MIVTNIWFMAYKHSSRFDSSGQEKVARTDIDFTYSTPSDSFPRRSVIKTVEAIGGQRKLRKLYLEYAGQGADNNDFFNSAIELLALDVKFDESQLDPVPREGPVVFIANHPYGVLDGIALTWLARKARPDVKVMANSVLCQAPDAKGALLPVDFAETKQAIKTNIESRKEALSTLKEGGAIGIFPAGAVGVSEKPHNGPAIDTAWHPFAAKLIKSSNATVIPIFFGGQNSRLFQMASHMSYTLRLALYFFETARRIGSEFELVVGKPITPDMMAKFTDKNDLNKFLRKEVFSLAPQLKRPKDGYPSYDREFTFPKRMGL